MWSSQLQEGESKLMRELEQDCWTVCLVDPVLVFLK